MSKQRIKLELPLLASRDEAEAAMNDLANAANNKRKLAARLDAAVLKLQEEAAPGMAECDAFIASKADALRAWAEANPAEFPKGRKSIDFLSGTLGFRTGTPKVALLSRAWNWEKVLAAAMAKTWFSSFVRTVHEMDKEKMLARHAQEPGTDWNQIGVKVVQDESFYVEPHLTETE